jgi:hypothetical protein
MTSLVVAAFLLGLFGSAHCVAMCGGVAGALSGGLVRIGKRGRPARATFAYNVGRIAAYAALGALVGALGYVADRIPYFGEARIALRLGAGIMLVLAGLYITGALRRYAMIERLGAPIWSRVRPIAIRMHATESTFAKLAVGALWGLMPCGLVYAGFGLALASGSIATGALVMLAFGLGTAPAMITTGLASARIANLLGTRAWMRRAAGALIVLFGLVDVASSVASFTQPAPICACKNTNGW